MEPGLVYGARGKLFWAKTLMNVTVSEEEMHSYERNNTTLGYHLPSKFIYDIDENCIGHRLRRKSSLTEYIFSKCHFLLYLQNQKSFITTWKRNWAYR